MQQYAIFHPLYSVRTKNSVWSHPHYFPSVAPSSNHRYMTLKISPRPKPNLNPNPEIKKKLHFRQTLVAVCNCQETVGDCVSILVGKNTFSHILCYTFVCELF